MQESTIFQAVPNDGIIRGKSASSVALDECSNQNEARPRSMYHSGRGGQRYNLSTFTAIAALAGLQSESMSVREAIHGVDEAEPPKPKTPRVNCWVYRGAQQFFVNEVGEAIPVRLNDPQASLRDRRRQLKRIQH